MNSDERARHRKEAALQVYIDEGGLFHDAFAMAFDVGYRRGQSDAFERAAQKADVWAHSKSCDQHDSDPCCHVRTGAGIASAIRSLATSSQAKDETDECVIVPWSSRVCERGTGCCEVKHKAIRVAKDEGETR